MHLFHPLLQVLDLVSGVLVSSGCPPQAMARWQTDRGTGLHKCRISRADHPGDHALANIGNRLATHKLHTQQFHCSSPLLLQSMSIRLRSVLTCRPSLWLAWAAAPLAALLFLSPSAQAENICQRMNSLSKDGPRCVIQGRGITSLRKDDFQGLNNLEDIYLYGNNLTCLPSLPDSLKILRLISHGSNNLNDHNLPPCKPSKPFDETELGLSLPHSNLSPAMPLSTVTVLAAAPPHTSLAVALLPPGQRASPAPSPAAGAASP